MSDDPRDPSLESIFTVHAGSVMKQMLGCLPGTIVSFDANTGNASVQPGIMEGEQGEDEERVASALPIINDVPVWAFGTAQVRIKIPLQAGDPVLIVWAGRSLDVWKQTSGGGPVDPGDDGAFNYNDCFCFPGRPSFKDYAQSGAQIEFTANTVNIGGTDQLVTKTDFLNHTHATAAIGTPSLPIPLVGPGFNYTSKLRG